MNTSLLQVSYDLENIDKAVERFWAAAQATNIIAFSGEMGAGKTTFIHRLCDYLGVQDNVGSPTFALINEYHFTGPGDVDKLIFHLDWYRLKDTEEAINAGMEDCTDRAKRGEAYCFIEWPEKAVNLLRPPYMWVSIETLSETMRKMEVNLVGL